MLDGHAQTRRAIFVTALPVEYQVVQAHLTDLHEEIHPQGTIYERGSFLCKGGSWDIGLVEAGAGNANAALEVERAISYFHPTLIVFVGIAGGLKDVRIGDVVAGTKVYSYESGKIEKTALQSRPGVGITSYRMEQRARVEARRQNWLQRLTGPLPTPLPTVLVGPIAAGEKVVAATHGPFWKSLKATYSDALAVEMESYGFLLAAHANQQVETLIIRGISDLISDKGSVNAGQNQRLAARHASAFAFEVLERWNDAEFQQDIQPPGNRVVIDIRGSELPFLSAPAAGKIGPLHNLPQPDYTSFIGRQKELEWLHGRLSPQDRAWQIVIAGIGGVGKSALALAIAQMYRVEYAQVPAEERFEAIIWVSAKEEILTVQGRERSTLPGQVFRSLEGVYTTIAQTLEREDITRAVVEEQHRLVQKALRTQRTLLIIDNLETVDDEEVRIFLRTLPPPAKCIITSREWVEVADVLKLTGLSFEETEKMIAEEARARKVELYEEEVALLFKYTAGLPLPIRLSMARLASEETFEQVTRWLGNVAGDLPTYCVQGQINRVHDYDRGAWRLLLAGSLFEQEAGASREALGAITRLSLNDRDDGLTLLQRLSLLNRTRDNRFRMLPLVQGYTGAELVKADASEQLTAAWLQWLVEFAQQHGYGLDLHIERVALFSAEYPTLLSAIRWCRAHQRWDTLLQLAEGAWFYAYLVGLFGELREILQAAIQAARALKDERGEGRFARRMALSFWVQGEYGRAWHAGIKKALRIACRYDDEREQGRALHTLADILAQQGRCAEGEQLAEIMLRIADKHHYTKLKVLAVYRLSEFASKKRQFDKALAWLEQGENWCREFGWSRCLAWNNYLRGMTFIQQNKPGAAEPFLLRSREMAISWSERNLVAHNAYGLAQAYANIGDRSRASRMASEAIDLYERLGAMKRTAEVEMLRYLY